MRRSGARSPLGLLFIELGDLHHCIPSFVLAAFRDSASFGFLIQADNVPGSALT